MQDRNLEQGSLDEVYESASGKVVLLSNLYLNFSCLYISLGVKFMALIRFSKRSVSICCSFKHSVSALDTFNLWCQFFFFYFFYLACLRFIVLPACEDWCRLTGLEYSRPFSLPLYNFSAPNYNTA